ncbi:hypothetical protein ACEV9C_22180 [Vibrio parahaemolyticus]|uniref:hypothetical protein n=1 Tax=Vibrio TaxID=662 RepID=UPI0005C4E08A|nr:MULTISPECIES: hypothetical protein [Vibrio]EII2405545.1 hypothetical protein [Vibrio parahaemolyticus]MBE4395084.1 hypothetical protein [Vibrio parahaemolyticus]MCA3953876.1 hypothetical protein [Vibrio vulnificus]MDG2643127.1 hypothetical protein [Vibrio parahaemolyticus]QBN14231.1 hypothetical protein E2I22_08810 [Vibrio vulnificus]
MKVWLIEDEIKVQVALWYYKKLKPQCTEDEIETTLKRLIKQGYKIAYLNDGADDYGIAGFFLRENFSHGKHLHIEDLLTKGEIQSHNENYLNNDVYSHVDPDEYYGGIFLIKWLKKYARENGCSHIKIDSSVNEVYSHRYLLKTGFDIKAHACSLLLPQNES